MNGTNFAEVTLARGLTVEVTDDTLSVDLEMVGLSQFPSVGIHASPMGPMPSETILRSAARVMECTGRISTKTSGFKGCCLASVRRKARARLMLPDLKGVSTINQHPADESSQKESIATISSWRLKGLVFVSGAVLMGLEMAGSRVLAIHFGSSIYVWGSIIGIFLAALAGGYYAGGLAADRKPSFLLLNLIALAAGCWLVLLPFYDNFIARGIRSTHLGARTA